MAPFEDTLEAPGFDIRSDHIYKTFNSIGYILNDLEPINIVNHCRTAKNLTLLNGVMFANGSIDLFIASKA